MYANTASGQKGPDRSTYRRRDCQQTRDQHLGRFRAQGYDPELPGVFIADRCNALQARVDDAAREICEFAASYDRPVLVTESGQSRVDLRAWLTDTGPRPGSPWLLPTAFTRLRSIAADYGIEMITVPAFYSSKACHECGVLGDRPDREVFRCVTPDCPVDTLHADRNAALVLARRAVPGRRCAFQPRTVDAETGQRP